MLLLGLLADYWLYTNRGFLWFAGQGTQEGQVLNKFDRAPQRARLADIIMFGSSFTRSGFDTGVFADRDLIPLNLGVSGGGPLLAYYMLDRIAPAIATRRHKPILVLEISPLSISNTPGWDEYPHFISAVRSRWKRLSELHYALATFREFNVAERYWAGLAVPSFYYWNFLPQVLRGERFLSFYGDEDVSGYAPLDDASQRPPATPSGDLSNVALSKIAYLDRFLRLAAKLKCMVVLYAYPVVWKQESAEELIGLLTKHLPETPTIPFTAKDIPKIEAADVQYGGGAHVNVRGAAKISEALLKKLSGVLQPSPDFDARWHQFVDAVDLPEAGRWTLAGHMSFKDQTLTLDGPDKYAISASDIVHVPEGQHITLEYDADVSSGIVEINFEAMRNGTIAAYNYILLPLAAGPGAIREGTHFAMSLDTPTEEVRLRVFATEPATKATIKLRRMWTRNQPWDSGR